MVTADGVAVATGIGLTIILVVVVTGLHPAAAAIVYVIVWLPGVLVLGVIAPVVASIVNPAVPL